MSTQAAAQHEQAADQYGHAGRPSMDEERIQMVVDYYKSKDTPYYLCSMPCPTTRTKPTKPSGAC